MMTKTLQQQLGILLLGSVLAALAYQFADRPVVLWMAAHHTQNYPLLIGITHLDDVLSALVFLIYPVIWIRLYAQRYGAHDKALLAVANSVVITLFLKDTLKFIFGRYWPATWIHHNLSFLANGSYGFNWFHGSSAYASFPSGHVSMTAAAMMGIYLNYPKLRWLAVFITLGMFIAQVSLYYHFLSDAIAGATLGYLAARGVAYHNDRSDRTDH